ncbi:MAG TPA: DUF4124 domain-containing protein [Gammaproteobacteria bacterium]|nr:DUF4124 domain-containing protein [Gammaproteobacteria bacterium]
MSRFFLFLLAFLLATAVLGDALYKWVDEKGNVHYSDTPHPGAVKVQLPHAQTYAPPTNAVTPPVVNAQNAPAAEAYSQLQITAPTDQQMFWNVESVTVSVALEPGLQSGDSLTISVDGQSKSGTALSQTFQDLGRGEHSAAASVTNGDGAKVIAATPVTFFIQRGTRKTH